MGKMIPKVAAAWWLALVVGASGQDAPPKEGGEKEENERIVRFLAVGDLPPYRQEIRDGVAHELPPPPGSLPPQRVMIPDRHDQPSEAVLALGVASRPVKVRASLPLLKVFDPKARDPETSWIEAKLPEDPAPVLLLLWRAPGDQGSAGSWRKPASLVLRETADQAGPNTFRVINVSPYEVAVKLGDQNTRLQSNGFLLRRIVGGDVPMSIAARTAPGGWLALHAGEVGCNANERLLVVVYRADGEKPRRPAKVVVLRERVVPIQPPPEADQDKKKQAPASNG